MPLFPRERIRLRCDTENDGLASDDITKGAPTMWRGSDVQFELGFFFVKQLITPSNFASVTLTLKEKGNKLGPTLMEGVSLTINTALLQAAWEDQSDQHCVISFTALDTRLDLQGQDYRDFWLVVTALTTDYPVRQLVLGATTLRMRETGRNEANATPPIGSSLIPIGANYDGSGNYTLPVITGRVYSWEKAANDLTLVNGSETLAASAQFQAYGSTVTLTGTPSTLVTARVRWPLYATADEVAAQQAGFIKPVNPPGRSITLTSDDGQWIVTLKLENGGILNMQPVKLAP